MENFELNQQAVKLLAKWDPFRIGEESYETETADVVAALQTIQDAKALANVIRTVYEYSFEQWIPEEACLDMANQLIILRHNSSCSL